ncbi:hypothetical protein [Chloroflexus aurantiacus]
MFSSIQLANIGVNIELPLRNAQVGRLLATSLCLVLHGWLIVTTPSLALRLYPVFAQPIPVSPVQLLARILALWGMMLIITIIAVPFLSILPLFGSLSLAEMSEVLSVIIATNLLLCTICICWLTLARTPPAGLFAIYGTILVWLIVPILLIATNAVPPASARVIAAFNPLTALVAPLAPAFPLDGPIADNLDMLLQITHGSIERTVPLHRPYLAGSGLVGWLLFGLTSFLARPLPRRWQRFDTLWLIGLVVYLLVMFLEPEWWSAALR